MRFADENDMIEAGDGAFRGANLTPEWLGVPVIVALALHLVLALGAILVARRQLRTQRTSSSHA